MKIPEYILNKTIQIDVFSHDEKTLPQGSFVKPIDWNYLPKHIYDQWCMWKTDDRYIVCYTRIGFVLVLKENLTAT